MIVEASLIGLIRTILIIIGILVVLRFVGQLLAAKRRMEEERELNERERKLRAEKERVSKSMGETRVIDKTDGRSTEDVDFEELD